MANIKISELSPLVTVQDADVLPIVDNAITKKVTAAILRSYTQGNSVLLTGAQTVAGIKTFTAQLASSVATGTAPFSVASTTKVTNLNADLLDGLSSADFQATLSGTGIVKSTAGTISYLTDNSTNWNSAYNDSIVSAAVTGTTTKLLTLNQQDGGTITASWTDDNTDAVTSVFGRTGAVVATEGDYSLTQLSDVTLTSPANGQVLKYNGTAWVNGTDLNSGTVTSVGMTVPTGLSVSGSPITTSGTLAVSMASGYSLPTDASQATWNTAYNERISTLTTTGSSGAATLSSNTLNIPNYTLSGLGGVPYTGATTNVDLGTHSLTASDLVINHASGSGVAASITKGGAGEALTVVKSSGSGNAASITGGTTLISELNLTTDLADAYIASAATWNAKQDALTLTTTGTSGAATLVGSTLNIPNYADTDTGITSLNGLTALTQTFAVGTSGTDFGISSASSTHTFNLPTASATNRGALSSADWTTFNNKQNALTNPITGTGTTNYLPKFTGTSALGDSLVFDNGTNVGIGTTSPATKLQVSGGRTSLFSGDAYSLILAQTSSQANIVYLGTESDGTFNISNNAGNPQLTLTQSGNLGLGTTTPQTKLVVNGAGYSFISGFTSANRSVAIGVDSSSEPSIQGTLTDGTARQLSINPAGGNVGIGTTSPSRLLNISGTGTDGTQLQINGTGDSAGIKLIPVTGDAWEIQANISNQFFVYNRTDNAYRFLIDNTGNVGVGTTSPSAKLEVKGGQAASKDLLFSLSKVDYGVTSFYQNYSNTFYTNGKSLEIEVEGLPLLQLAVNNLGTVCKSIFPNGNVLIGTTTDGGYKLDVNGTARVKSTGFGVIATFHDTSNSGFQLIGDGFNGFNAINSNQQYITQIAGDEKLRVTSSEVNVAVPITLSNTVAAGVAVASTHKVTVKIGGVTYYLLASNV